jgi:hypothetical protein
MERVADHGNLHRAMRVVRRNKGSGGIDGMTVAELEPWLAAHGQALQPAAAGSASRVVQPRAFQHFPAEAWSAPEGR